MKTIKRFLLPILVAVFASISPRVLGFENDTWQFWWVTLPILFMSWCISPLQDKIIGKVDKDKDNDEKESNFGW